MFGEPAFVEPNYFVGLVVFALVFMACALVYAGYLAYDTLFKKKLVIPPECEEEELEKAPWDMGPPDQEGDGEVWDGQLPGMDKLGAGESCELTEEELNDMASIKLWPIEEAVHAPPPEVVKKVYMPDTAPPSPKQVNDLPREKRHEAKEKLAKIKRHVARKPKRRKKIPVRGQLRGKKPRKRGKRKK